MLLCLQPFELIAEPELGAMERFAAHRFACGIRRLEALPLPDVALDRRRDQFDATEVLRTALAACPDDAARVLAVTERDLCIPMLTFVFGQAQLDGKAALLSLARLRPEFHGLAPNQELLRARIRKETLHELGHTFGLFHCTDAGCAMALSVNVAGIDAKQDALCDDCAVRLEDRIATLGLRSVRPRSEA
ncbi:MAG: archaemetzincin [Candidatus Krumholzibacteriia bacterium]